MRLHTSTVLRLEISEYSRVAVHIAHLVVGHAVQPPRTSEDTGVHAERDPRRNGMDNPFGAGLEPLHPQLALLTGVTLSSTIRTHQQLCPPWCRSCDPIHFSYFTP